MLIAVKLMIKEHAEKTRREDTNSDVGKKPANTTLIITNRKKNEITTL